MKLTVIEVISTIRKKVSLHSFLIMALIILLLIGTLVIGILHVVEGRFFEGAILPFQLLLLFMLYMIFKRRASYMHLLQVGEAETSIANLEKWIQQEYTIFRSFDMVRLVAGTLITLAMLLLLFFQPQSYVTGVVFTAFIALITLSMWKSWSLMRDGMNLQDLKHCQRDQTSEIS